MHQIRPSLPHFSDGKEARECTVFTLEEARAATNSLPSTSTRVSSNYSGNASPFLMLSFLAEKLKIHYENI